eukprot:m.1135061 g.1135061  ORF g.1135061 m.1135061 type:complete len:1473 (-) comp24429_c2_seq4:2394-6812(-)
MVLWAGFRLEAMASHVLFFQADVLKSWTFRLALVSVFVLGTRASCTRHSHCGSDQYCDTFRDCLPCSNYYCCTINDAVDGICPCFCPRTSSPPTWSIPSPPASYPTYFGTTSWRSSYSMVVPQCTPLTATNFAAVNTTTTTVLHSSLSRIASLYPDMENIACKQCSLYQWWTAGNGAEIEHCQMVTDGVQDLEKSTSSGSLDKSVQDLNAANYARAMLLSQYVQSLQPADYPAPGTEHTAGMPSTDGGWIFFVLLTVSACAVVVYMAVEKEGEYDMEFWAPLVCCAAFGVFILWMILLPLTLDECDSYFATNGRGLEQCEIELGPHAACIDHRYSYDCECEPGFSAANNQNNVRPAMYGPGVSRRELELVSLMDASPVYQAWYSLVNGTVTSSAALRSLENTTQIQSGRKMIGEKYTKIKQLYTDILEGGSNVTSVGANVAAAAFAVRTVIDFSIVESDGVDICCNEPPVTCTNSMLPSFYITTQQECEYANSYNRKYANFSIQWRVLSSEFAYRWHTGDVCKQQIRQCGNTPIDLAGCCVSTVQANQVSLVTGTLCRNTSMAHTKCRDVDECRASICAPRSGRTLLPEQLATCVNTPGGYTCVCSDAVYSVFDTVNNFCVPDVTSLDFSATSIVRTDAASNSNGSADATASISDLPYTECLPDDIATCSIHETHPDFCSNGLLTEVHCDANGYVDYVCVGMSQRETELVLSGSGLAGLCGEVRGQGGYGSLAVECPGLLAHVSANSISEASFLAVDCYDSDFSTRIFSKEICAQAARDHNLNLSSTLEAIPELDTLDRTNITVEEQVGASTPSCLVDASGVVRFTAPTETETMFVCQRVYGCTEQDRRRNRFDCDKADTSTALWILLTFLILTAVAVFLIRRYNTTLQEANTWIIIVLVASQFDFITDVVYYSYETFVSDALQEAALTFILLQFLTGSLVYVFVAHGPLASGQWAYRLDGLLTSETRSEKLRFFGMIASYPVELTAQLVVQSVRVGWKCAKLVHELIAKERVKDIVEKYTVEKAIGTNSVSACMWAVWVVLLMGSSLIASTLAFVACVWGTMVFPLVWTSLVMFKIYFLWPTLWTKCALVGMWLGEEVLLPEAEEWMVWSGTTTRCDTATSVAYAYFSTSDGVAEHTEEDTELDMDTSTFFLALGLLFEFVFETIGEVIVQIVNNTWRDSWSALAILSVLLSSGIAIDGVYRLLHQRFVMKRKFGSPASFNLSEDDAKNKERKRLENRARRERKMEADARKKTEAREAKERRVAAQREKQEKKQRAKAERQEAAAARSAQRKKERDEKRRLEQQRKIPPQIQGPVYNPIYSDEGIPTDEHNTGSACPLNDNNVEGHAYLDYPSNPNIKSGGRFESNRFSQHWGQDVVPTTGGAGGFDADTPSLSAMAPSRFTAGSPPHGSAPEWDATPGRVGSLGVGAGESTPQQHLRHDAQMGQSSYADPESTGLSVEEDEIYDSRHFGF